MSLVKEPARRTFNAILVAGASGVYLSGGFGPWELLYPAIVTPVVYLGLSILSIHRSRLAHALLLGHRAPLLGQPDLALHADLVVRMHDLRRAHRTSGFWLEHLRSWGSDPTSRVGNHEHSRGRHHKWTVILSETF